MVEWGLQTQQRDVLSDLTRGWNQGLGSQTASVLRSCPLCRFMLCVSVSLFPGFPVLLYALSLLSIPTSISSLCPSFIPLAGLS